MILSWMILALCDPVHTILSMWSWHCVILSCTILSMWSWHCVILSIQSCPCDLGIVWSCPVQSCFIRSCPCQIWNSFIIMPQPLWWSPPFFHTSLLHTQHVQPFSRMFIAPFSPVMSHVKNIIQRLFGNGVGGGAGGDMHNIESICCSRRVRVRFVVRDTRY